MHSKRLKRYHFHTQIQFCLKLPYTGEARTAQCIRIKYKKNINLEDFVIYYNTWNKHWNSSNNLNQRKRLFINYFKTLNFHLFCRSVIFPFGYFTPRRLLILLLWRVGYPLHEQSKFKRFSNSLQIINKKSQIVKKYDRVRSSGNKGKCKISKLFSFHWAQNKWELGVVMKQYLQHPNHVPKRLTSVSWRYF